MKALDFIKSHMNENTFTTMFSIAAVAMALIFINSPEGRAAAMETFSIGFIRVAFFLATSFLLIKMLAGVDVNIKEDLFADKYTTTAFVCSLLFGIAQLIK
jgi:hypothetical protein